MGIVISMTKFNLFYESVIQALVPYEIISNGGSHITVTLREQLNEAVSVLTLIRGTEPAVIARSKNLKTISFKVLSDGIIIFKVISETNPRSQPYTITLQFSDWDIVFDNIDKNIQKLSPIEKLRRIIKGSVIIDCTCKSFRYDGYAYILTQKDGKYGQQLDIAPKKKNPKLEGTVCKHLRRVIENVEMILPRIVEKINPDGTPKP